MRPTDAREALKTPEAPTIDAVALKRPISVLVVVYTQRGEYLLLNRTRPAGFWQSVTGSLEPGESPRQCAVRELREETGLEAGSGLTDLHQSRLFPIIGGWKQRYRPGVCFNREHWFALRLPGRRQIRFNPREHSEARWLSLSGALQRCGSRTNRAALRLIASRESLTRGASGLTF